MYCPKCRAEYEKGIATCAECKVALVAQLPHEPELEYEEYVTVAVDDDMVHLAAAKALLDDAAIPSIMAGDSFHNLFALLASPVALRVLPEHADEARALLADLDEAAAQRSAEGEEEGYDEEGEDEEEPAADPVVDVEGQDDYITILSTSDIERLAEARQVLADGNVPCIARGDTFPDLFALLQQPLRLRVPKDRVAEARDLLGDIDSVSNVEKDVSS